MSTFLPGFARHAPACVLSACLALAVCAAPAGAALPETPAAAVLHARYAALTWQFAHNQFQRPLYLDSLESAGNLKGDIYALVDYPFPRVSAVLQNPENWCDVLILHINTKYCGAATANAGTVLTLRIGKKVDQPIADAYRMEFAYRVAAANPDYVAVRLDAGSGPLGTSDYRILIEMAPVEGDKTILHFTYAYSYGFAGRLAMQVYLATAGHSKVGFTLVGTQRNGQPDYVGGVRGVVERNTMRYFLAIDAYLGALAAPPAERLDKRLQSWYTSTELYALQLHDVGRKEYIDMKGREIRRQQSAQ